MGISRAKNENSRAGEKIHTAKDYQGGSLKDLLLPIRLIYREKLLLPLRRKWRGARENFVCERPRAKKENGDVPFSTALVLHLYSSLPSFLPFLSLFHFLVACMKKERVARRRGSESLYLARAISITFYYSASLSALEFSKRIACYERNETHLALS